ncbi:MAG: plasmid pRiA4b ORF-3 family protein [Aestuariivirga sp.]
MKFTQTSSNQIVRLKITLDDIKPAIWRRVEVPLTTSLLALHEVIQAVMLFENYHLFDFATGTRGAETRYIIPDPNDDFADDDFGDTMDASKTELGTLIEVGIKRLTYAYDFGDNWQHTILIEAVAAADPTIIYPRFIEGANRAPPEDVGGIHGFENFLNVMAKPKHPEHAEIKQWYGRTFDPKDIAEAEITTRIAKLAKRKNTKKSAAAKPTLN